jgi:hypothetical protein
VNLYEIIVSLDGKNYREREEEMNNMGVDASLRLEIHRCFSRNKLVRDTASSKPKRRLGKWSHALGECADLPPRGLKR